jgi:hypothetical protein
MTKCPTQPFKERIFTEEPQNDRVFTEPIDRFECKPGEEKKNITHNQKENGINPQQIGQTLFTCGIVFHPDHPFMDRFFTTESQRTRRVQRVRFFCLPGRC